MLASMNDHKEVVEILLSTGADVNLQDNVCDIYDCYDEICFSVLLFVLTLVFWFRFLSNRMETLPFSTLLAMATKTCLKCYYLPKQMFISEKTFVILIYVVV